MKINSILSTKSHELVTVRAKQTVRDAIALLKEHNIGALVVTGKKGGLVGILSERDIVRKMAETEEVGGLRVKEVMTRKVIVGVPQDDVMSVAHTMTEKRFRHLPIVSDDRVVGMVSIGDIMKAQRDQYRGEIDTLETQILATEMEE